MSRLFPISPTYLNIIRQSSLLTGFLCWKASMTRMKVWCSFLSSGMDGSSLSIFWISHWKKSRLPRLVTLPSRSRISLRSSSGSDGSGMLVLLLVVVRADVFVIPGAHVSVLDDSGDDCGVVHAEVHREVLPVREVEVDVQPSATIVVLVAVGHVIELFPVNLGILLAQFCLSLFVPAIQFLALLGTIVIFAIVVSKSVGHEWECDLPQLAEDRARQDKRNKSDGNCVQHQEGDELLQLRRNVFRQNWYRI